MSPIEIITSAVISINIYPSSFSKKEFGGGNWQIFLVISGNFPVCDYQGRLRQEVKFGKYTNLNNKKSTILG